MPTQPDAVVPAPVRAVAAGRPVRLVWVNELGGRTFEVGADTDRCFVKWTPVASGIDLGQEAARLFWAVAFTPVPRLLGELGVADRWTDLAVATWSTEWNYGPGWDKLLLQAYGVPPDPDRTRYYRLLWDLGP